MKLGIKGKQVLGVTAILGVVVVVLSLMDLARLAQVSLDESRARADLLSKLIFHRAREIAVDGVDIRQALGGDPGLRSILQSSLYSKNVTFAAIADVDGVAIAHADPALDGKPLDPVDPANDLAALVTRAPLQQLAFIYHDQGRNLQLEEPLLLGNTKFGSIRIGVSTLLIRHDLNLSLQPAAVTALIALGVTVLGAMLLAQALLRPIHVIRSGLTRLGRGELGVHLDLDQDDEFGELGAFFNTVSAQLSADRSQMAGQVANLESAVEHLEDAVAIISPGGVFLFVNPAMRSLVPDAAPGRVLRDIVANDHPIRQLFDQTLASRQPRGPLESGERLMLAHPVHDASGALVGVMLIARNLEYLSQVQSTLRYSRKLAALGRLSSGVAHEVKNPLNAMMIHLELLRQQTSADGLTHVETIGREIRRLDEVVQGFLKFTAPGGPGAAAGASQGALRRSGPHHPAGSRQPGCAPRRRVRRRAGCERGSHHVAAGLPQPRVERLPGDAAGRHAPHHMRGRARAAGAGHGRRHRRRHQPRAPAACVRSVFHDQTQRQRHRSFYGVSHGADA